MKKAAVRAIFEQFRAQDPHPTTELNYCSAFELLIAVMLSAQATDVSVNAATLPLFKVANTPEAFVTLGEEKLKSYIRTIGLYHSKARHIIQTCTLLLALHAGKVPSTREDLEALPGVGRKTANVILNTVWNQPTLAVDTHVFRVANRTGLAAGDTPVKVEKGLLAIIPPEFLLNAHHWLILHGRYVCTARKPHCQSCSIRSLCEYKEKNRD